MKNKNKKDNVFMNSPMHSHLKDQQI